MYILVGGLAAALATLAGIAYTLLCSLEEARSRLITALGQCSYHEEENRRLTGANFALQDLAARLRSERGATQALLEEERERTAYLYRRLSAEEIKFILAAPTMPGAAALNHTLEHNLN